MTAARARQLALELPTTETTASPARALTDPDRLWACNACAAGPGEPCFPGCEARVLAPDLAPLYAA